MFRQAFQRLACAALAALCAITSARAEDLDPGSLLRPEMDRFAWNEMVNSLALDPAVIEKMRGEFERYAARLDRLHGELRQRALDLGINRLARAPKQEAATMESITAEQIAITRAISDEGKRRWGGVDDANAQLVDVLLQGVADARHDDELVQRVRQTVRRMLWVPRTESLAWKRAGEGIDLFQIVAIAARSEPALRPMLGAVSLERDASDDALVVRTREILDGYATEFDGIVEPIGRRARSQMLDVLKAMESPRRQAAMTSDAMQAFDLWAPVRELNAQVIQSLTQAASNLVGPIPASSLRQAYEYRLLRDELPIDEAEWVFKRILRSPLSPEDRQRAETVFVDYLAAREPVRQEVIDQILRAKRDQLARPRSGHAFEVICAKERVANERGDVALGDLRAALSGDESLANLTSFQYEAKAKSVASHWRPRLVPSIPEGRN